MSGFDPDWLALREAADARARAGTLAELLRRPGEWDEPLRVLDLASGTGANLRYLAPRVGGRQEWLLTDVDRRLLDTLPAVMETWAAARGYRLSGSAGSAWISGPDFVCGFRLLHIDLARGLERLPIQGQGLVTASALLDLVSSYWVAALVTRCREAGSQVLFALTYDGRVELDPAAADDALVIGLVNRHQRTDKGFGPALGPLASDTTEIELLRQGYGARRVPSDWRIEAGEIELQQDLLQGWARAATQMAPEWKGRVDAWCARRMHLLQSGISRILVGHQDLLGLLPDQQAAS